MKKFLTPLLSCALAAALATTSFAMTRGTVVIRDKYYDDVITTALPGDTIYIGLCSVPSSSKEIPTKAYLFESETLNSDTGDNDKLFGTGSDKTYSEKGSGGRSLDIVKKQVDANEDYYFAVLDIKEAKTFPSDGYDVIPGTIRVTRQNGDIFKVEPKLTRIGYDKGEDELDEAPLRFSFDRDDDIELSFPGQGGSLTGIAKKDFTLVAGMKTDEVSSIASKYPNAFMDFYIGNGASLANIRSPKLFFEASEDHYLYEIGSNNTLTNRTNTYDDDEGGFVVTSNTLGKYVVSDTKITSTASSVTDDDDNDDDVVPPYNNPNNPSYVVPVNPSTGARA